MTRSYQNRRRAVGGAVAVGRGMGSRAQPRRVVKELPGASTKDHLPTRRPGIGTESSPSRAGSPMVLTLGIGWPSSASREPEGPILMCRNGCTRTGPTYTTPDAPLGGVLCEPPTPSDTPQGFFVFSECGDLSPLSFWRISAYLSQSKALCYTLSITIFSIYQKAVKSWKIKITKIRKTRPKTYGKNRNR